MNIDERLIEHYRRWNIEFDYEEQFANFKNRLIKALDKTFGRYLARNPEIDSEFKKGIDRHKADKPIVKKSRLVPKSSLVSGFNGKAPLKLLRDNFEETSPEFGDTYVYTYLDSCSNLQELATNTQIFFWAILIKYDEVKEMSLSLINEINSFSSLTPSASFRVQICGSEVVIYPPGEEFLDKGIIDYTLSRLGNYPKAAAAFKKALEIYLSGNTSQYRNLLDDLRFSLEQLLREIRNNDKPLEKQKRDIVPWLKSKGIHVQTSNCYKNIIESYILFQNDAVKHDEDFSLGDVEFMIYLTGNFMKLLLKLDSCENE